VSDYPASKAGIESFAIEATTQCGTKKYTGNEFKDIADKYSILIGGSSVEDYGYIQLNTMTTYFNNGWDLFTEAVMNPTFNESDVALLKNKMIARVKGMQSSPDNRLEQLVIKNGFEGTAYETDPDGTVDALSALTAADLKNYYATILNKNRIFLVVVGNIGKDELISKIRASFSAMPSMPYTPVVYQLPTFNDNKVLIEPRDLQTNYIGAIMNAPKFTDADFVPYRLGIGAFSGLLFRQLRTNLHLSYSQGAYVRELQMPYAEIYVSTTKPKEAVNAINESIKKIRQITLSDKGMREIKSGFITSNYTRQQSSAAITASLGMAEILGGWEYEDKLPDLIEGTTPELINGTFNKYIIGVRWSYLGNQSLADAAADAFKVPVSN
jgi:predicted Zn-dependent peptidase